MTQEQLPPEPGTLANPELGEPGDVEPTPDAEPDEPTGVNDDEDEDDE